MNREEFRPGFERICFLWQRERKPLDVLLVKGLEILKQDAPRQAIDSHVMNGEHEPVAVGHVNEPKLHQRSRFEVYRCLDLGSFLWENCKRIVRLPQVILDNSRWRFRIFVEERQALGIQCQTKGIVMLE